MLILDKPQELRARSIGIPLYHRGHLSFFPKTRVWLCLLPGPADAPRPPEVIMSPIHFDSWRDLWRITASLSEKPGVVNTLLQVLRRHNINILSQESSSMERQSAHHIELIADVKNYGSRLDGSTADRINGTVNDLADLRRALLAAVIWDISSPESGGALAIERVTGLYQAGKTFAAAQLEAQQYGTPAPLHDEATILPNPLHRRTLQVTLPEQIARGLSTALGISIDQPNSHIRYLRVSDTQDRFLRVYFLHPSDAILSATIGHHEKVGAIAAITDVLQVNNWNILSSLLRLHVHGETAHFEVVLQAPPGPASSTDEMRATLERHLSQPELVHEYGVAIGYPDSYRSPLEMKPLVSAAGASAYHVPTEQTSTALQSLATQYPLLQRRVQSPGATNDDRARFQLAGALLAEETVSNETRHPHLFISYSMADDERFKLLEAAARRGGFRVITGKDLVGIGADSNQNAIRELIASCTHFIGLWSEEGGVKTATGSWPSPWLHWELGVAQALNKPFELLISNELDDACWKRLAADKPHTRFSKTDFRQRLHSALRALSTRRPPLSANIG